MQVNIFFDALVSEQRAPEKQEVESEGNSCDAASDVVLVPVQRRHKN